MFSTQSGAAAPGANNGFTRRSQRHAARSARPLHTEPAELRRHVANDHGDPRAARLEGVQAFHGQFAGSQPDLRSAIRSGALADAAVGAERRQHWWWIRRRWWAW